MKITVRIASVEVIIERPKLEDWHLNDEFANGPEFRKDMMENTVIPMLREATDKAKELYTIGRMLPKNE